jgi:hypothetical protein
LRSLFWYRFFSINFTLELLFLNLISFGMCLHFHLSQVFVCFLGFFFFCSTRVWIQGLWLYQPFFVMDFFQDRVSQTFAHTGFKLRSSWSLVSWVTRITGVSHQHLAQDIFYLPFIFFFTLLVVHVHIVKFSHTLVNFPKFLLLMAYHLIPLLLEKTYNMISVFLNLLRCVLWSNIWSILENAPCSLPS